MLILGGPQGGYLTQPHLQQGDETHSKGSLKEEPGFKLNSSYNLKTLPSFVVIWPEVNNQWVLGPFHPSVPKLSLQLTPDTLASNLKTLAVDTRDAEKGRP